MINITKHNYRYLFIIDMIFFLKINIHIKNIDIMTYIIRLSLYNSIDIIQELIVPIEINNNALLLYTKWLHVLLQILDDTIP